MCLYIQGIIAESLGTDTDDHVFTLVEGMADANKTGGSTDTYEELPPGDDEAERSVASVEHKEMTVYEVYEVSQCLDHGRKLEHFLKHYLYLPCKISNLFFIWLGVVIHYALLSKRFFFFFVEIHYGNANQLWKHGLGSHPQHSQGELISTSLLVAMV